MSNKTSWHFKSSEKRGGYDVWFCSRAYNVLMILHMMFTLTINSTGWGKGHDCPPLLKSAVPMNGTSISLRPIHTQLCFVEKECHGRIAEWNLETSPWDSRDKQKDRGWAAASALLKKCLKVDLTACFVHPLWWDFPFVWAILRLSWFCSQKNAGIKKIMVPKKCSFSISLPYKSALRNAEKFKGGKLWAPEKTKKSVF